MSNTHPEPLPIIISSWPSYVETSERLVTLVVTWWEALESSNQVEEVMGGRVEYRLSLGVGLKLGTTFGTMTLCTTPLTIASITNVGGVVLTMAVVSGER